MDEQLEEALLRRMVKKCLKLGNEVKQVKSEINVKRKGNAQLKQHINELDKKKEIIVLKSEKANEQKCWDVIGMSECRVDLLLFEDAEKINSNEVDDAETEYRCQHPGCESVLKNKWVFNRHQNIHKARYQCEVCQRCFITATDLKKHKRIHTDEWHSETNRIYQCQHPGCESAFKNKSSLQAHQNIHLDKYRCRFCQKCLPSQSQYQNHIRTHTGERPFVCDWIGCGEQFKAKFALKDHMFHKHGNKFPFKCNENGCGKLFKSNKGLQQHLKSHSSDRPIQCQVEGCDSRFKLKLHLTQHMKFVHSNGEVFCCDFENCQNTYTTQQSLKRHRKTHL